MSDDFAWLLGVVIGDGCVTDQRDGRIDITSEDWEITERFTTTVRALFGLKTTTVPTQSNAEVTYFHSRVVRDFLRHLGVPFNKADVKIVPRAITTGRLSHQSAFLRGLFDADGGVNTSAHVTSASHGLLREVHVMLLNLGVVGTLVRMTPRAWRINISGVDLIAFRDKVGFFLPRKMAACRAIAERPDGRGIPKVDYGRYPAELGVVIAKGIITQIIAHQHQSVMSRGRKRVGYKLAMGASARWGKFLKRVVRGKASLTDVHLAGMSAALACYTEFGGVCAPYLETAAAGGFLDEIVSITRETAIMRDICVPEGHAFVGNGFLNHNSQGMSMDAAILALAKTFAAGQVYVGLSRLRSSSGLILTDHDFEAKTDPLVMSYYRAMRERKGVSNNR